MSMKWGKCKAVGSVEIDGRKYTRDVILDRGKLRKRRKKPSREFREEFGHTPVSLKEEIPGSASAWWSAPACWGTSQSWTR